MMMTHIASMVGGLQRPFDPALLELIAGSATMQHVQGAHDRVRRLLKSCATPPISSPMASNFCLGVDLSIVPRYG
jgi:hypothetical protein